jgi:hypothetical protein
MIESTSFARSINQLILKNNYVSEINPYSHSMVPGGFEVMS